MMGYHGSRISAVDSSSDDFQSLIVREAREPAMNTLLRRAIAIAPKPVIFGACGAAGCALAALLLGELLWRGLGPPPPQLRLVASPSAVVKRSTKNTFQVKLARDYFQAPVTVTALGLPAGVRLGTVIVPTESDDAELEVEADEAAQIGTQEIQLRASANAEPTPLEAGTTLVLTVRK